MAVNEIHQGDIGTVFEITMMDGTAVVDLTGYTSVDFTFQKPDRSNIVKTGAVDGDPTNGIVRYTTISGDLDQAGTWKVQASVVIPGWDGSSDIAGFKVHTNL